MKTSRPPRYYVGSVTGWALNPERLSRQEHRPSGHDAIPIVFTVHDRLSCHRTIAEFRPSDGWAKGGLRRWTRERRARELCDELNARYEAWLAEDPERLRVAV